MRFPIAPTLLLLTMAVSVHAWTPLQSSSQRSSNPLSYSTDSFQDIFVNGDTRHHDKDEVFSRALLGARLKLEKRGDSKMPTVEEDHTELAQRKLLQARLELEKQRQPQKKNGESTRKSTLITQPPEEELDARTVLITPPPAAESKEESNARQLDREESKLRALLKARLEMEQRHKKSQKQSRYEPSPPPSKQTTVTPSTLIKEPPLSTRTFAKARVSSNPSTNEREQRALMEARLELERKEKQNKFRNANEKYTLPKDSINVEERPEIEGDALLREDKMEKSRGSADGADRDATGTPTRGATPTTNTDNEEHEPPLTETRESTPQKFTIVNPEPTLLHIDASESRDSTPTYFTTGVEKVADDKFKIVPKSVGSEEDLPKATNQRGATEQTSRITKPTVQPDAFEEASRITKTLWQGCSILAKEGLELVVEAKDGFSTSKVGRSDITYSQAIQKVATSTEGLAKLCWVLGEGAIESFALAFEATKQGKQQNPKTTPAPSAAGEARITVTRDGENGRDDDTPSAFFLD